MGSCCVKLCWMSKVLDVVGQWALRVLYLSFAPTRTLTQIERARAVGAHGNLDGSSPCRKIGAVMHR
jgi:hypothetical protein